MTLEWDLDGRNIVRRNGSWLATSALGETSFTDSNPPQGSTYVIRNRADDGTVVDHDCDLGGAEITPPAPITGCIATTDATGVTLTWDFGGQAILRKNGAWLTTVSDVQTFTDTLGTANDSYIIRSWATGQLVDHTC